MMALICLNLSGAKVKAPECPKSNQIGGGISVNNDHGGQTMEELELERLFGEDEDEEGGVAGGTSDITGGGSKRTTGHLADRRTTLNAISAPSGTNPHPQPPSNELLPPALLKSLEVPHALSACDLVQQLGIPEASSEVTRRPQGHYLAVHPRGSLVNFRINPGGATGWFKVLQGSMVRVVSSGAIHQILSRSARKSVHFGHCMHLPYHV